eukprot:2516284-Alexandrium_andersonii.AAC.1
MMPRLMSCSSSCGRSSMRAASRAREVSRSPMRTACFVAVLSKACAADSNQRFAVSAARSAKACASAWSSVVVSCLARLHSASIDSVVPTRPSWPL